MEGEPLGSVNERLLVRRPRARIVRWAKAFSMMVVALFWVVMLARNWSQLAGREWTVQPGWAVSSLVVYCLYFLGLAAGWAFIVRAMGFPLPLGRGSGVWLLSMPARYVPGNVWHIAARIHLAERVGVGAEGVVASSTLEQVITVLSAACLGLAWFPSWTSLGGTVGAFAFFLVSLVLLQPPLFGRLLQAASRLLHRPVPPFSLGYRHLTLLLVWYVLVNLANGVAFDLLTSAIAPVSPGLWPVFASAYCLAYVVGYVSFLTPSGLGVREAALTSMLVLHMPLPLAITASLLARLLSTLGEAVAVLAVGLPLARQPRQTP